MIIESHFFPFSFMGLEHSNQALGLQITRVGYLVVIGESHGVKNKHKILYI